MNGVIKRNFKYLACLIAGIPCFVNAMIFADSGESSYNTTAPTNELADSGWQFQGEFGQYLGTPVSPFYFLTAQHFGASIGDTFVFDDQTYTVISYEDDSDSDLRLIKVDESFPSYAPLYRAGDEIGAECVIFGRGLERGAAVYTTNIISMGKPGQSTTTITNVTENGWVWGDSGTAGTMRWGQNTIDATYNDSYFYADFDGDAGLDDECALVDKDSGGAWFVQDEDGVWKLAGISWSVGYTTFSRNDEGTNSFSAAIYDSSDLYFKSSTNWYSGSQYSVQSLMLASRVSVCLDWIDGVIPDLDTDADFLPDDWEDDYFSSTTSAVATVDSDNDGFDNLAEYYAGTDPTNSASYFSVQCAVSNEVDSSYFVLSFSTITNRIYAVEETSNLVTEAWSVMSNVTVESSGELEWLDEIISSPSFYRVGIELDW